MLINEINTSKVLSDQEKDELIDLIKENLSINLEVENLSRKIYHRFLKEFNGIEYKKDSVLFSEKKVAFTEEVFGQDIMFIFNCYNVYDKGHYDMVGERFGFGNGFLSGRDKITVNVGLLSGSIKTNPTGTIQHEIEHFFQKMKTGGLKPNNVSMNIGRKAYDKALDLLRNKVYKSVEEYRVAFLIYTHADFEEDGFVNQLYQALLSGDGDDDEIIKNSPAFKYYVFGKKMIKEIEENRKGYEGYINKFGYRFNDFLSIYKNNNKRFISKIGKVLTKYNEELTHDGQVDMMNLGENG